MSNNAVNTAARDILRDLAAMSVGAVAGIVIYNAIKNRRRLKESPASLIDSITCYKGGNLSSIITFGWDQDEMFAWARETYLNSEGKTEREHLFEAEEYDGKLLIVKSDCLDDSGTPEISTIDLDPFGMGTSLSYRRTSGKEEHWDLDLIGGQLQGLLSGESELKVSWDTRGNLISITDKRGEYRQEMTYYTKVANRIFPDLNFLANGLSTDLLASFSLGERSANLVSSMVIRRPDYHFHLLASYLCDSYDRPLQVRHETTEIKDGETTESTSLYDIKYL